ncbi:DNA glycosylase AlkZ-like family protein [Microbacterium sp. ASV49]|uniref:Crosslink repair DNA glycosylase YcaQ family protein n=1 Tax=Microbacterium candidum TaxID=3041922 RepID=A0ABT7N219_9MICO|nr:crosslink repair DNA glycosylase YcaQ family protein [Microbacterium sp. ASV49]MDL9980764.1 crosslink repair DNA glycosylase YcaQ family protein [Microbacterium sp. ASV49]
MLSLDRDTARRVAVTAQLLSARRPADIVETVDGLTIVNIEPTAAVAPSADLILWSRLGWPYQPADLARIEQVDRAVFEWGGFYRPMTDLPLLRTDMRRAPRWRETREWLAANEVFRRDVVARLRDEGPLHAAEVPDTAQVSWRSSGWTNNRNAQQMLEVLTACGDVAVWGRDAKGRLFDLSERIYPAAGPDVADEDAARERAERRLGALGIAREKGVAQPTEPVDVGGVGELATVDGTDGQWRVDAAALTAAEDFEPRTALLSPFDRLVFDRIRLQELFGYEYILEMYKPAAKRRWGYFALPILHGDRFVGKLDAKADRKAGVFRIHAVHEDVPFTRGISDAVEAEIAALAAWLGLEPVYT